MCMVYVTSRDRLSLEMCQIKWHQSCGTGQLPVAAHCFHSWGQFEHLDWCNHGNYLLQFCNGSCSILRVKAKKGQLEAGIFFLNQSWERWFGHLRVAGTGLRLLAESEPVFQLVPHTWQVIEFPGAWAWLQAVGVGLRSVNKRDSSGRTVNRGTWLGDVGPC